MSDSIIGPLRAQSSGSAPQLSELFSKLGSITDLIWPVVGVCLLGMFIYGGFMWMFSSGDPQKLAQAKGVVTWAVLGTVIVASSVLILWILGEILGIPNLSSGILPSF